MEDKKDLKEELEDRIDFYKKELARLQLRNKELEGQVFFLEDLLEKFIDKLVNK